MISKNMEEPIKKMRKISRKNKQVNTGIASAQSQQPSDYPIIQIIVNEASKEIDY